MKEAKGQNTTNKLKPECVKSSELELSKFPSNYSIWRRRVYSIVKCSKTSRSAITRISWKRDFERGPFMLFEFIRFIVEKGRGICYGERLLFIARISDALLASADLYS